MIEFESTQGEKAPKSETTVVYDPRTGRIVYVHEFIGDGPEGRDERGRIALQRLKRHSMDASRVRVMHLPRGFRFKSETLYRVDLRAGKIAASPVAPAGKQKSGKKR